MKEELSVSLPHISLAEVPALQGIVPEEPIIPDEPLYERLSPPYDSPTAFFEHLFTPHVRDYFAGSFSALALRDGRKHLKTLISPPSESEVLAEVTRLFPEERHPRFLFGGGHGCTLALPEQRRILKIRYHAADPTVDAYTAALDLFCDMTYESDISYLLGTFPSFDQKPFVAPVVSQITTLSDDTPICAKMYTLYERLPGKSLGDLLRSDELALRSPRWHTRRFLSDVSFTSLLRSLGLLDSDRKPDNVLVMRDGTSRYVDHEFVMTPRQVQQAMITSDGKPWQGPGTTCYLAPERLIGDSSYPLAADIFSLACVYVTGATGKHPYGVRRNDREVTVAYRLCEGEITNVSLDILSARVPADIARVCISGLNKNPSNRPTITDFVAVARQYGDI